MIVARSKNGVIGADNRIPWRLRDDMRFFREMTTGNTVVMGRKTFESLGRPLPNRRNVVVTRDKRFRADGVDVVHSPEEALALPRNARDGELFVIGGQQIYEALLPYTDVVYVTEVQAVVDGDAFFPELGDEWELDGAATPRGRRAQRVSVHGVRWPGVGDGPSGKLWGGVTPGARARNNAYCHVQGRQRDWRP